MTATAVLDPPDVEDTVSDTHPTIELPIDERMTVNKDGSVRRKPGPKPGAARRGRRAPAPGRRPAPARPKSTEPDYRPAIVALGQLVQFPLSLAARVSGKQALAHDGIAVAIHMPTVAEALNETAKSQAHVAALLDKLSTIGPYGLVISAIIPLGLQILANHGVIGTNETMGILTGDQLVELATAHAGA